MGQQERPSPAPGGRRRHCWVLGSANERGPWPGLVLEWRRTNTGGWAALAIYVPDPRKAESVQAWFAAELVRPLDAELPSRAV